MVGFKGPKSALGEGGPGSLSKNAKGLREHFREAAPFKLPPNRPGSGLGPPPLGPPFLSITFLLKPNNGGSVGPLQLGPALRPGARAGLGLCSPGQTAALSSSRLPFLCHLNFNLVVTLPALIPDSKAGR